jgi:hypothetical protein
VVVTEEIQQVAQELNQKKREAENLQKLMVLGDNLVGKIKVSKQIE